MDAGKKSLQGLCRIDANSQIPNASHTIYMNCLSIRPACSLSLEFVKVGVVLLLLSMFLLLAGCVDPGNNRTAPLVENANNKGRLSLFLNLRSADGPAISMVITSVEFLPESGMWITRSTGEVVVDAAAIKDGQKFLTRIVLPPGKYRKIRFVLAGADQTRARGGQKSLVLKDSLVELPLRDVLQVSVGDSKSLFLTWDTKESLKGGVFYPILRITPKLKKLIADVAYVACPDIDTVFMINTEKNRVIDSLGIQGEPIYLYQSKLYERDKVYVLTKSALIAFSPSTNKIIERTSLSMIKKPVHMTFSPDGRWAYILDKQRSTVSRLDVNSGTIDTQVRLDYEPNFILYMEKRNLLVVSLGLGQSVVALDPETLHSVGSISTGMMPDGLMDWNGRYLYIAESGSNSVMVYDFDNNSMLKRISVGFLPRRFTQSTTFLYVANQGSRSVSVLHPGIMDVTRTINLTGQPSEMAYVFKNKWVYAGNGTDMSIDIIESTTNEIVGSIELGAPPMGIFVIR